MEGRNDRPLLVSLVCWPVTVALETDSDSQPEMHAARLLRDR
jgi:hypothetical protein